MGRKHKKLPRLKPGDLGPSRKHDEWVARQTWRVLRWTIFLRDGCRCVLCGAVDRLEIDHIVPRSAGGSDTQSNLRTLCAACNRNRRNRLPESFKKKRREARAACSPASSNPTMSPSGATATN